MNELDSTCGVSDDELTKRFKEAIRIDNEITVADYDETTGKAYLEYSDGKREYVS